MLGRDQEISLLAYLLKEPQFLQTLPQLNEKLFFNRPAKIILEIIRRKYLDYTVVPTQTEMCWLIENHPRLKTQPEIVKTSLKSTTMEIYSKDTTEITGQFLKIFIAQRELEQIKESIEGLGSNYENLLEVVSTSKEKLEGVESLLGRKSDTQAVEYPFSSERLQNLRDDLIKGRGDTFSTGFPNLDSKTRGGYARGDLICVTGYYGVGKSCWLVSSSWHLLTLGMRVLYYALDNTEDDIRDRFRTTACGIPSNQDMDLEEWEDRVREASVEVGDRLVTRNFPADTLTPREILSDIDHVQRDLYFRAVQAGEDPDLRSQIDVVVIDYANCLVPPHASKSDPFWLQMQKRMTAILSIGQSKKCLVLTAVQQNEDGKIAASKQQAWPCTLILDMMQTKDEYAEQQARLVGHKNRYGSRNFTIPIHVNYATQRVRECLGSSDDPVWATHKPEGQAPTSRASGARTLPAFQNGQGYNPG